MSEQNRTIADEAEGEKIEKIKEEFKGDPESVKLRINRVPKYVSDDLKELADEKFAGDYGMALTHYHQMYERVQQFHDVVADLQGRIARLETRVQDLMNEDDEISDEDKEGLDVING